MALYRIPTAVIAGFTVIGLGNSVMADPPSKAGEPQFAFTSPFMDIDDAFDLAHALMTMKTISATTVSRSSQRPGIGAFAFPASSQPARNPIEFA